MASTRPVWPGLSGPPPGDELVELAERLTGALEELEVVRLLVEEVERRVRPTHWCLLLGDRDSMRIEHVGGRTSASLLRRVYEPQDGLVWRALDSFETQVANQPARAEIVSVAQEEDDHALDDAVAIPFGGFEVVGCLELVDVLRPNPSPADLASLRRALRLGGVGIRNARRHRDLSRGESVDEITGLAGPNRFRAALQQELARTARTRRPLSVVLVDLDRFREVNRVHGRLFGSSLLAEVGAILQMSIRNVDLASRWTGDTFALLLPETGREGAARVVARIQEHLRSAPLLGGAGEQVGLTASAGIAVFKESSADPERAIYEAEASMRAAQSAGEAEAVTFAN